jgi:hypothetical protein
LLAAAAAIAVTAPPNGAPILAVLALAHLAVIAGCVARAWLLPGRTSRAVSMQLQVEIVGLALLASMLPPLAPAALALRMAVLRHRHAALRWKQL